MGNAAADALADEAAAEVQVQKAEAANFLSQVSIAKKVQRRALAVLRVVGERKARTKKEEARGAPSRAPSSDALFLGSSHAPAVFRDVVWCCTCLTSRPTSIKSALGQWLRSPCPGPTAWCKATKLSKVKPARLPEGSEVHVGRALIPVSHALWRFRGLVWCGVCGAVGSRKAQGLAEECPKQPRSEYAKRTLVSLRKGDLPPGISAWPDEAADAAQELLIDLEGCFAEVARGTVGCHGGGCGDGTRPEAMLL